MEIKIDQGSFENAARVLNVINGSVVDYKRALELMHQLTAEMGERSTYFGTAGFYITCFDEELPLFDENNGQQIGTKTIRHAAATIMPYSVMRYLKMIGRMPNEAA